MGDCKHSLLGYTASLSGATRGEEVLHYLSELAALGRDVAAWVVIDDDPLNLEKLGSEHKVETYEDTGLDAEIAKMVRDSLALQDAAWCSARQLTEPVYPKAFQADRVPSAQRKRETLPDLATKPEKQRRASSRNNAGASVELGETRETSMKPHRPSVVRDESDGNGDLVVPVSNKRRASRSVDASELSIRVASSTSRRRSVSGSAAELASAGSLLASPSNSRLRASCNVSSSASPSPSGRGGRGARPNLLAPDAALTGKVVSQTLPKLRRSDEDEQGEIHSRKKSSRSPSVSQTASPTHSPRRKSAAG